jgi:hypothetical protein
MNGLERAEFLFAALDFPVSSRCGLPDLMMIAVLTCEMPKIDQNWWNRIPAAAWVLIAVIDICCNLLSGYGARRGEARTTLLLVLPLIVSISFCLIADIDSPRDGVVRARAENLESLFQSLRTHQPRPPWTSSFGIVPQGRGASTVCSDN